MGGENNFKLVLADEWVVLGIDAFRDDISSLLFIHVMLPTLRLDYRACQRVY